MACSDRHPFSSRVAATGSTSRSIFNCYGKTQSNKMTLSHEEVSMWRSDVTSSQFCVTAGSDGKQLVYIKAGTRRIFNNTKATLPSCIPTHAIKTACIMAKFATFAACFTLAVPILGQAPIQCKGMASRNLYHIETKFY